jgi:cobalamin biosynthesis protein CobT
MPAPISPIDRQEDAPLGEAMALICAREADRSQKPPEAAGKVLDLWREFIEDKRPAQSLPVCWRPSRPAGFCPHVRDMLRPWNGRGAFSGRAAIEIGRPAERTDKPDSGEE